MFINSKYIVLSFKLERTRNCRHRRRRRRLELNGMGVCDFHFAKFKI